METLDGPVLVVAGPGTGKTQLLSLRAVNLLQKRDIGPHNILCLTYTEAGAEAMTKRLVSFLGRDAYDIRVSTFHGFASGLRSTYPEFFPKSAFDTLITDLQTSTLINTLLNSLPVNDPLFQGSFNGINSALNDMKSFITQFKRSGLNSNEFRHIVQQSLDFMHYIEHETNILELVSTPLNKGKAADKELLMEQLEESVNLALATCNAQLKQPLVTTPGIYIPYAEYFAHEFSETTLFDSETNKTTGFAELRDKLFTKGTKETRVFKDEAVCRKALSALTIFDQYQSYLSEHALYDFDDMILDAIAALESHPELKQSLQDIYQYIQVDEYQDTNGVQMKLVDLLTDNDPSPNVLVVGDDDQAIMRFQGASVTYINQFEQHYKDVARCVLKTNYRSTPALVELGQVVAHQIETRSEASTHEKQLTAYKTENIEETSKLHSFSTKDLQYYALAQSIRGRIDAGFIEKSETPEEAIAVIAPVHASLRGLIPYLKLFNIPFSYTYTASVSQIASLQTLLALVRCIAEYSQARVAYAEAWLPQILASDELGLSPEDYIGFALEAKHNNRQWMKTLQSSNNPRLKALHTWIVDLAGRAPSSPLRPLLLEAAQPLIDYYRSREEEDPFTLLEFNYGLKALLDFIEGELSVSTRGLSKAPVRLSEMVTCFNESERFKVTIDATLPLKREKAVTLTSAHSSKGLEFDLVYLVDADDSTWHPSARGGGFLPQNMLFGTAKDEDDARRLLFVAVTRARYELAAYRGKEGTVRELLEQFDEREVELSLEELEAQSEQSWQERYRVEGDELGALIQPDLENMKISVSQLNAFVEYQPGCTNSSEFVNSNLLKLPETPSFSLEFGSAIHAFFEEYLNHVIKSKELSFDALIVRTLNEIKQMDFEDTLIEQGIQRFQNILNRFMPVLDSYIDADSKAELWVNAHLDEIPLVGKCDLLVFDAQAKTIKVFDYKTSLKLPEKNPSSSYMRQLQFYRLLLESSPEFRDWRVVSSVDLYVEPMKELDYELCDPVEFSASDAEIAYLTELVKAVWYRIQNGLFDTTAFETSEHMERAQAANVNKDGTPSKRPDRKLIQKAYEDWLIDEWKTSKD